MRKAGRVVAEMLEVTSAACAPGRDHRSAGQAGP